MTATKPLDLPLPLEIKREINESMSENEDSGQTDDDDDNISISSLLQPSILDKDCFSQLDSQNDFLHLTSLVRRVYFSYLHKSIVNNYNVCATSKNENISRADLKKFASRLELHAVRASLEASLYRQAMLQIISDVKNNTKKRKIHKKLAMYLDTPSNTASIGIQTCFEIDPIEKKNPIVSGMNYSITKQYEDNSEQSKCELRTVDEKLLEMFEENNDNTNDKIAIVYEPDESKDNKSVIDLNFKNSVNKSHGIHHNDYHKDSIVSGLNVNTSVHDIFGDLNVASNPTQHDEDESRDSLIQHLENIFCESDDSSDLTSLIEKHSSISKSNINLEVDKICVVSNSSTSKESISMKSIQKESTSLSNSCAVQQIGEKRKVSFSNYKRMKKRAQMETQSSEMVEDKQMKKMRGIWFVERVHQVSKLKAKMMELSMRNYRKHGRIREKFFKLFGESDEQEMMPDSPIHIEEHLTACKERIAPWVVKHLMPYYTQKIIPDRLLFKAVAKHIADMLIIKNTFPEEDCVTQYIKDYFRNKPSIKLKSDIYI